MALFEAIDEKTVKIPLKSKTKDKVIKELLTILKDAGKLKDVKTAQKAILEREELASTGLGGGIAIPHAKIPGVERLTIAIGLSPKGIDFDSLDGQPSTIFFLILAAPDQTGPHLETLTEIAKISRDSSFCDKILHAGSAAEVVALFRSLSGS
ncbi:PTS sugar transporter subunit IIA [Spirochaeta isovalerica]|uniref:Mannitol/fructose-specific phosphotransferase system IIA component (Ntr-type) n=1 Tax=Spirochaeta isovalerica TaxID=150 RepID=A0A841R6Q9_9SPIO|nr:PTS sugar transporter subunit IIA [Spirochaeta isovalerica]MBB6479526.1 mannitol/fructose-specific phosphotransferase system IIA component (Ntr-type) [Spirochaeta isovalerica]